MHTVFVVFHEGFSPELTRADTNLCTHIAVNQAKDKYLFEAGSRHPIPHNVVCEYELPWHDSSLQGNGYMETSVYVHLLHNEHVYKGSAFVGVTQYDMTWSTDATNQVRALQSEEDVLFMPAGGSIVTNGKWHRLMFANEFPLNFVMSSYNKHFGTTCTVHDLESRPMALWQSAVMHRTVFEKLTGWLEVLVGEVTPWANRAPYKTHWGFLGGLTERAESIFYALQKHLRCTAWKLVHSNKVVSAMRIVKEQYGSKPSPASKLQEKCV